MRDVQVVDLLAVWMGNVQVDEKVAMTVVKKEGDWDEKWAEWKVLSMAVAKESGLAGRLVWNMEL